MNQETTTKLFQPDALRPTTLDRKRRRVDAVLTKRQVDRDGEIVEPRAFESSIDIYKQNPIVLFNHQSSGDNVPIGRVVPESLEFTDNALEGTLQLRGEGRDATTDRVWAAVEDGVLSGVSVGFRIRRIEPGNAGDPPRIVAADLLETSIVNVPANTGASLKSALMGAVREMAPAAIARASDSALLSECALRLRRKLWVESPDYDSFREELEDLREALDELPTSPADRLAGLEATIDELDAVLERLS